MYLDFVQYYASSENVSLLPLVVRLNSVRTGISNTTPGSDANNARPSSSAA